MYILGISCYYHDSSACLMKDGRIVAAAEEERFTRKKHDNSFPSESIKYCLDLEGIDINDVNHVGFYEKPLQKFERILFQHIDGFPFSMKVFLSSLPSWINEKLRVPKTLRKKFGYMGDVKFIEHHMAHAASSFLLSPFDKAAILTIDGVGEWTTTAYGIGNGNSIILEKQIKFPHSIGLLYSTITAYLGFSVNNSEYKVMGLAAYGEMERLNNKFYRKLKKVIDVKDDGSFRLRMEYFKFHYSDRMPSNKFCDLMGGPVNERDGEITQKHKDIAAAVQLITEDVVFKILKHVHSEYKVDNVVLAGGVALNSVLNGKIIRNSPFKNVWIQPNATDGGTSMGACAYIYHTILDHERLDCLKNGFLGPEFSDEQIKEILDCNGVKYSEFTNDDELVSKTAELLNDSNVVGWFQGRMEWGPRALGSRSILSNASNKDMQEILNLKVKHREKFRPFAPVVCEDDAAKYFDCDKPVPEPTDYMLMVYPIFEKWRSKIPSVTHVDGSGRLQTIRHNQNKRYYDVIKEFGKLSGIPILVNTSFNIRGEPIVCEPEDAYRCMMGTGIDYLVIGKYLVKRNDNPDDMWDSEELAFD